MAYDYDLIHVAVDSGVAIATIDAPPINVMTIPLYGELVAFTTEVEVDEAVRVVVFRSADPDFFIAHFDVEAILMFPVDGDPVRETSPNRVPRDVRTGPHDAEGDDRRDQRQGRWWRQRVRLLV